VVDIAHKVVGVGSVGLRAYLALCVGSSRDDVLFLQLKQARRSVVARFVHGDQAWHAHQGQRVVEYQKALQTVTDPLLGWTSVGDRQYYVRQFRDMKGAVVVDGLDAAALADYAGVCGLLLAKGHARTSGASNDRGLPGAFGQGGRRRCAGSRAATPTRPSATTPPCSTRSAAASFRPNPESERASRHRPRACTPWGVEMSSDARTGDPMIHSARGVSATRRRSTLEHTTHSHAALT
jgi:hypothetical protein